MWLQEERAHPGGSQGNKEVFMEKGFALILKVWTDRNEVHPKQTERYGRASEEAKHSPGHA